MKSFLNLNKAFLFLILGVRTFGRNFKVIAEVIGTKTESHVRSFYVNYRRRYNLDAALKEYEAEHGPTPADDMVIFKHFRNSVDFIFLI